LRGVIPNRLKVALSRRSKRIAFSFHGVRRTWFASG
jgi:hypothetical protein